MCLLADLTLMLAWNAEEAGKIIETYKLFETKPPDLIMARAQQYPHQKVYKEFLNSLQFCEKTSTFIKFSSWWRHSQTSNQ